MARVLPDMLLHLFSRRILNEALGSPTLEGSTNYQAFFVAGKGIAGSGVFTSRLFVF